MNKKQRILYWEAVIKAIIADHKALDKACNNAMKAGTLEADGPLYTAIWKSFDDLLRFIDRADWILWFIRENNYGKGGQKAKWGKLTELEPVKTPRKLATIIAHYEGENHGR